MDYPYFLSCKVKKSDVMLYFKTSDTMVIVPTFKQLFSRSESSTYKCYFCYHIRESYVYQFSLLVYKNHMFFATYQKGEDVYRLLPATQSISFIYE